LIAGFLHLGQESAPRTADISGETRPFDDNAIDIIFEGLDRVSKERELTTEQTV